MAVVPTDYYYVETKRNQLFFRLPDVYVKPEQPGIEDAAVVFQAALNKELGPRRRQCAADDEAGHL
jgi:hypothetical protein